MFSSTSKIYAEDSSAELPTKFELRKALSSHFDKSSWFEVSTQLSFSDLKTIESRRREIIVHTKSGRTWDFVYAFSGTLLPYAFTDYLFWLTMFIYGIIRFTIWRYPQSTERFPVMVLTQVTVVGGFLNYFLVFFTNNSYQRFMMQYHKVMAAKGAIFNFALLAKNNLPRARALRIVRWLQACFLLAFVGLSDAYGNENFFLPLCETYQLLTKAELERIDDIGADSGGIAYREVLSWITDEVAALGKERIMPDKIGDSMWKEIIRTADNLAAMFDYEDQPIPFVYVHLTYIMCLAYLPLLAYSLATGVTPEMQSAGVELFSFVILFLACVFVLGLRDLGHILQDPFGDDLQDMSVLHYVTYTIQMSRRLLLGSKHATCDDSWELQNEAERPGLGMGFVTSELTASQLEDPPAPLQKLPKQPEQSELEQAQGAQAQQQPAHCQEKALPQVQAKEVPRREQRAPEPELQIPPEDSLVREFRSEEHQEQNDCTENCYTKT